MRNKILGIVSLLLALIIVGEFYYLFVYKKNNVEKNPINIETNQQNSNLQQPHPEQAISEAVLADMRILKQGVIKTGTIKYTMEGTIQQMRQLEKDGKRAIDFRLVGENGKSNGFFYPDLDYISVVNNSQEVDLFSLKDGDRIFVTVEYDVINREFINITIQTL